MVNGKLNELHLPDFNTESFYMFPTNKDEIEKIIMELSNTMGGINRISSKVLKILNNCISEPLAYIYNLCIAEVQWPDYIKQSEIIPIFKTGDKHNVTKYRPISLISNLAKIFEKI